MGIKERGGGGENTTFDSRDVWNYWDICSSALIGDSRWSRIRQTAYLALIKVSDSEELLTVFNSRMKLFIIVFSLSLSFFSLHFHPILSHNVYNYISNHRFIPFLRTRVRSWTPQIFQLRSCNRCSPKPFEIGSTRTISQRVWERESLRIGVWCEWGWINASKSFDSQSSQGFWKRVDWLLGGSE